jgi:C-terminal processing protease CtpA/Prc
MAAPKADERRRCCELIGLHLVDGRDGPRVLGCVAGGPAARSGLFKQNDTVIGVDGKLVESLDIAVHYLSTRPQLPVNVTVAVRRSASSETVTINMNVTEELHPL